MLKLKDNAGACLHGLNFQDTVHQKFSLIFVRIISACAGFHIPTDIRIEALTVAHPDPEPTMHGLINYLTTKQNVVI